MHMQSVFRANIEVPRRKIMFHIFIFALTVNTLCNVHDTLWDFEQI